MEKHSDLRDKIFEQLTMPYIYFSQEDDDQKVIFAEYIKNLDPETLLIPSSHIFSYPTVLAGITEKHIEYMAKKAPENYKKEIISAIMKDHRMEEALKIADLMDGKEGKGGEENRLRLKRVVQYIWDNKDVFEF